MTNLSPTIAILTLNVKSLNTLIKRQRLLDWIEGKIQLYTVYKRHTLDSNTQVG